ncbi:hypothetical protein DY000_02041001 [Brassica cretica]|uniref:Uncharacterized protein n=3 Tax=Brassica TaxID=3705 RepID=A0ABQ7BEQ0_BRACR|nr:hypothetical protein DY000_02041001 [Brassica cretica]
MHESEERSKPQVSCLTANSFLVLYLLGVAPLLDSLTVQTRCKLLQRPKKRAKLVQKTLLMVSPGTWLSDLCKERYEVRRILQRKGQLSMRKHGRRQKKNMNSQGWDTNMERGDNCWKNIKISLTEINIAMKRRYRTNMRHVKPLQSCHRNDMDNWCKNCYHYKQMKQFVRII